MKVTRRLKGPVLQDCPLEGFDLQVDPYRGCGHLCRYCYVLQQAETDWSREVLAYQDVEAQLSDELSLLPPQSVYLGWHTDPYQPCEAEALQTRRVLELLLERGCSASILTKSDRVLRDRDLLQAMDHASVSVSVAFQDDRVRGLFETDTPRTGDRIAALETLRAAGIRTSALICPVIPFVTDVRPLIDSLSGCTDTVWIYGLNLTDRSDPAFQNVHGILETHFPDLVEPVEAAVFSRAHPFWEGLRQDLNGLQKEVRCSLSIHV